MDLPWRRYKALLVDPPADPAHGGVALWPWSVVLGLAIAGMVWPPIAFAAAALAYAFADRDQATLLMGVALVRLIMDYTFLSGG